MEISCTNIMVPGNSLLEKAHNLKNCGFDAISVFEDIGKWTTEKEEELFSLKSETGIRVCEFCFSGDVYGQLMASDPHIATRSKSIYLKAIEIGNRLGSISEMEYQYAPRSPVPLFDPYLKMPDAERERFKGIYTELSGHLQGDAKLLLEPINRYESPYLNNMKDNAEIVEELRLPGTGLLFDTFHMSIEQVDMCATFGQFASLIKHIHLGDNNRLLPGKGNLPWEKIFAAIHESGYNDVLNLECAILGENIMQQIEETAVFLKSFIRK